MDEWFVSEGLKRDLTQVLEAEGGSVSLSCDELVLPEERNDDVTMRLVRENSVDSMSSLSVTSISTSVETEMEPVSCFESANDGSGFSETKVSLTPLSPSPDPLPVCLSVCSSPSLPDNSLSNPILPSHLSPSHTSLSSSSHIQSAESVSQHFQPSDNNQMEYQLGVSLNEMVPITDVSQPLLHPLVLTTRRSTKRSPKENSKPVLLRSPPSIPIPPFMSPSPMNYPVLGYMPQVPMMMCVMTPNGQLMWVQSTGQPFPLAVPEVQYVDSNIQ